jgi:hypothetical protein
MVVCRCGKDTRPTTGQPHLSLGVHGVVDELELVPRQCFPPARQRQNGDSMRREAQKLLGWVRP